MPKLTEWQVNNIAVKNQQIIVCHCPAVETGKETYGVISHRALQIATRLLKGSAPALTVFMVYALNQDGFVTTSGVHHFSQYGLDASGYHRAVKVLKANGYLTQDEHQKNKLEFWSIPKGYETIETLQTDDDYISPMVEIMNTGAGCITDDTGYTVEDTGCITGDIGCVTGGIGYIAGDIGCTVHDIGCIVGDTENNTINNTRNSISNNTSNIERNNLINTYPESELNGCSMREINIYFDNLIYPDKEQIERILSWKAHYKELIDSTLPDDEAEREIILAILDRYKDDHKPLARMIDKHGAWVDGWDAFHNSPNMILHFGYVTDDVIRKRSHNITGIPEEYYIDYLDKEKESVEMSREEEYKSLISSMCGDNIEDIKAEVEEMFNGLDLDDKAEVKASMKEYRKHCTGELDYLLEYHWRLSKYERLYGDLPF